MQQATLSELPSAALHRFPGAPRPGIDIDIYEKDGLQYVSSSSRASKGASFLLINDVSDVAGRSFHAAFKGHCHITKPSMQLAAGFSMASGAPLRWPPPRRGVPRRDQALGKVIGLHYSLIPLVDMLLEKYTAEVERVKVSVCEMSAAAAGSESAAAHDDPGLVLTEDWLEPSDGLMVWVAYALRELSKAPGEPPSIRTTAWLLLASICAADMTFDELLSVPDLAAWALAAMERYEPPEGDPLAESDCWHVELQLRQALTGADPSCPVKEVDTGGTLQDLMGHPLETNPQRSGGNLGGKVVRTGAGVTVNANKDPERRMRAVCWEGARKVVVEERPRPLITDPHDAIVRVSSTAICGSDLHLYLGSAPGMQAGDILGHEFMGTVEEVGPEVRNVRPGDRVVSSFDIACGQCRTCSHGQFSGCDITNPSKDQEMLYGARTAGLFGYAHVTGGYEGGQADFVRVPFADMNLLHVPSELPDNQVLLLSDILSTAWYATELGEVGPGKTVAIWGAGPGGILAAHCSQVRGADRVILIDNLQYRLDHAASKLPGLVTVNFGKEKVKEALERVIPGGPDVCIEAVGFHYCKSIVHAAMMKTLLETDTADILNELIYCCRKGGIIACIGVYVGRTNGFNIGAFMEKGLTLKAGQTPVQKYWHQLLDMVKAGKLDPTIVITHELPLEDAPHAYKIFNDKMDGCIKVVLKTGLTRAEQTGPPSGPPTTTAGTTA